MGMLVNKQGGALAHQQCMATVGVVPYRHAARKYTEDHRREASRHMNPPVFDIRSIV